MSANRKKVSRYIAYLLRHEPSGLNIRDDGFVEAGELVDKINERWSGFSKKQLEEVVYRDSKGRYQLEGGKIRALYGHSIEGVDPDLPEVEPGLLYHGTTESAASKILKEGLKPKGRNKVHLSSTPEEARKVAKRRTDTPVILEIDASRATDEGKKFWKAGDTVYLSERVAPGFISIEEDLSE